ncbi:MAG: endonuclease/exonuclease/phosphatase family protein [Planctomycetota bacterium]
MYKSMIEIQSLAICLLAALGVCPELKAQWVPAKEAGVLRVATYNVSLNRPVSGQLAKDLAGDTAQAKHLAAVIRAVQPDILLLNEVDFHAESENARKFAEKYLADATTDALGGDAWPMRYSYDGTVNTGVPSGMDLNANGKTSDPEDAWGYGRFSGQYGMAVLSRYEIDVGKIQTLQEFAWADLPGALRPKADGEPYYYDDATWAKLRLPSKSFWGVPISTPLGRLHVIASHPTPPAFDGPEDRNGCRNHDEIRLIQEYIEGADFLRNDDGEKCGLAPSDAFVVLGDLNSDPVDGGSRSEAIRSLLSHPRVANHATPSSSGAASAAQEQAGANERQSGNPKFDTGDFSDRSVGNLRVDYVIPSANYEVLRSGVFWPEIGKVEPSLRKAVEQCLKASDHHLVWVDLR